MIPFARMIQYGNVVDHDTLLDIDFSRQDVGNTNVIDYSGRNNFTRVRGTSAVVAFDAVLNSNVMTVSANTMYTAPINAFLNLVNINFEINVVFKTTSTAVQCPWCTGDWNGTRIPGINFSLNANAANYMQWFIDNGSSFNNIITGGTNTQVWEDVTFRCTSTEMIVINNRLGTTQNFPRYTYGAGTSLALFGSYTGGTANPFIGSMQKLHIKKIP